jgi:hypothetical protein
VSEFWGGLGLVLMGDARCRLFNNSFCFLGTSDGEYDDNLIAISVHSVFKANPLLGRCEKSTIL